MKKNRLQKFFKALGASIVLIFSRHVSINWERVTRDMILAMNKVKELVDNPNVRATAELLFPNGVGDSMLDKVIGLINDAMPELEIAQGCEEAVKGITDPAERANAILSYIVANIGKLPEKWRGKHLEDIAVLIMKLLIEHDGDKISTTAAKAMLHVKLGQMKADQI